jgi:putative tryptophan/tyrosine transport system substrate-binding protein
LFPRRTFLAGTGAVLLAAPLAAEAQPAGKVYRVGLVFTTAPASEMIGLHPVHPLVRSFLDELRALGYVQGRNLAFEPRSAEGRFERFREILEGLVSLKADVLVVNGNRMTQVAKEVTRVIPIVMVFVNDPVEDGLVATLAHPGGNVTGVTGTAGPELEGKRVELLKEALPKIRRVAFLGTRSDWEDPFGKSTQAAARALHITLIHAEHTPDEYGDAFARIVHERPDALLVPNTTSNFARRRLIVEFATKSRLPGMYYVRNFTEDGGLMSYGPDFRDQFRRLAVYVDKILKGAKPADLPVEQPTKFELVINLKTAKALGLTIPPSLLGRADELIQ